MKSLSVLRAGVSEIPVNPLSVSERIHGLPTFRSAAELLSQYQGDDHIYLIYPEKIRQAARQFLSGFNGRSLYAVKSNPHPSLIAVLWEAGIRQYDVASLREVEFMAACYPEAELYLMHPVKSRRLIARAYELGVRNFVLDCEDELLKILDSTDDARDLNLFIRLALPKSDSKNDTALPLAGKFGADFETAQNLLRRVRRASRKIGLSFHVGSQCMEPQSYDRAIAYAARLINAANIHLDAIDVGGGFPVAYPNMDVPALDTFFDVIHKSLIRHGFGHCEWLAEPGRALCAEGGSTLARVELRKGNDLYLNDGVFGSLFDAGHFRWNYPLTLHRNRPPSPMNMQNGFRLFGPTCDSMDVMEGPFNLPADTAEGDWIEFAHLGAYGSAMATHFNGFYSTTFVAIED